MFQIDKKNHLLYKKGDLIQLLQLSKIAFIFSG